VSRLRGLSTAVWTRRHGQLITGQCPRRGPDAGLRVWATLPMIRASEFGFCPHRPRGDTESPERTPSAAPKAVARWQRECSRSTCRGEEAPKCHHPRRGAHLECPRIWSDIRLAVRAPVVSPLEDSLPGRSGHAPCLRGGGRGPQQPLRLASIARREMPSAQDGEGSVISGSEPYVQQSAGVRGKG
jgi:hypothetical protein